MKYIYFVVTTFLVFNLILLSTHAQTCDGNGNPNSTAYIRRENDCRYEGIKAPEIQMSSFTLISLTTGFIPSNISPFKLQVPNHNDQQPKINVRSPSLNNKRSYYLDPIEPINLNKENDRFYFRWSNYVIKQEQIPLDEIYATAHIVPKSTFIYLPVIFDKPSGIYNIVLFARQRAKINTFQIKQKHKNEKIALNTSRSSFQKGPIIFQWDGREVEAGNYKLVIEAELERDNSKPQFADINITFQHDPKWLK